MFTNQIIFLIVITIIEFIIFDVSILYPIYEYSDNLVYYRQPNAKSISTYIAYFFGIFIFSNLFLFMFGGLIGAMIEPHFEKQDFGLYFSSNILKSLLLINIILLIALAGIILYFKKTSLLLYTYYSAVKIENMKEAIKRAECKIDKLQTQAEDATGFLKQQILDNIAELKKQIDTYSEKKERIDKTRTLVMLKLGDKHY